jgi:ankyrin repeat protein
MSTLKLFFRKKGITDKYLAFSNIISILLVVLGLTYLSHLYYSNQIYYASRNGDVKVVNAILTRNPKRVNFKRKNGDTPLHVAAYAGHSKVVIILLDNGAMINEKNNEGNTPLYEAILFRHKEIVEILITRGARIDERNKSNETPLSWALKYGGPDIIDLLRQHGAKE